MDSNNVERSRVHILDRRVHSMCDIMFQFASKCCVVCSYDVLTYICVADNVVVIQPCSWGSSGSVFDSDILLICLPMKISAMWKTPLLWIPSNLSKDMDTFNTSALDKRSVQNEHRLDSRFVDSYGGASPSAQMLAYSTCPREAVANACPPNLTGADVPAPRPAVRRGGSCGLQAQTT